MVFSSYCYVESTFFPDFVFLISVLWFLSNSFRGICWLLIVPDSLFLSKTLVKLSFPISSSVWFQLLSYHSPKIMIFLINLRLSGWLLNFPVCFFSILLWTNCIPFSSRWVVTFAAFILSSTEVSDWLLFGFDCFVLRRTTEKGSLPYSLCNSFWVLFISYPKILDSFWSICIAPFWSCQKLYQFGAFIQSSSEVSDWLLIVLCNFFNLAFLINNDVLFFYFIFHITVCIWY